MGLFSRKKDKEEEEEKRSKNIFDFGDSNEQASQQNNASAAPFSGGHDGAESNSSSSHSIPPAPKAKKSKSKAPAKTRGKTSEPGLPEGVELGEQKTWQNDKLFVGEDYREIFSWEYDRSWPEILSDLQRWTPMPFTLGIEQELIIAYDDGSYPPGEEMVYRMKEIVKDAMRIMKQIVAGERNDFLPIPDYIREKVQDIYGNEDKEKGYVMDIGYRLPNGSPSSQVDVDTFGRDGNVTAITYILELVTPPCEYIEELAYWASTLFLLAKTTLPSDLHIIASGINPAPKNYMRGLTQADHFHIDHFRNDTEKAMVYCMLRNFIPHLISLSVNSPIINNKPTDVVKVIKDRIAAPNCIRSLRLKYNASMLSTNVPDGFLPYLTSTGKEGQEQFLQAVKKASLEDGRMQDIFPFTEFGTIEFRVCDAQISICRRIGMAMIIQALALKARKLLDQGKWVPNAGAATISTNRKRAYERGLISLFKFQDIDRDTLAEYDPEFAKQYMGPENDPVRYMTQAVQRMFFYIQPELKELGYLYSPFLKPLLQSVFGSVTYAKPPITEAEYQLSLYDYKVKQGEKPTVLEDLIYFTIQYCQDPLNNPLTGTLTLPKEMRR
ncbi:MAG: hypothetical protein ACOC35_03580 [Promethearchaeia archaeon]